MLVSIIVPTRDRGATLRFALRTITAIDDDRMEIIVSDNSSVDDTRAVVAENGDPRIRYICTPRRTGMTQNWEFALGHARGDWIGYVGDDDGLLPDALERLRAIVAETGARALRSAICNYIWPSLAPDGRGRLFVPLGRTVEMVDSHRVLMEVLTGRAYYSRLPVIYNGGFAERALFDKARDSSGRFFRSRIPDLYSGIVLARLVDRYVWSDIPFVVNGASIHSTGTAYLAPTSDRGEAIKTFEGEDNLPFHPAVPLNRDGTMSKSLQTLILESWHQARDLMPDMPALTPEQQLAAVMAEAEDRTQMASWIEDFANQHRLDATAIARLSAPQRRRNRVRAIRDRAWMNYWHSDLSPSHPVEDVEAATRLTAQVIGRAPTPAQALLRNLVRVGAKTARRGLRPLRSSPA